MTDVVTFPTRLLRGTGRFCLVLSLAALSGGSAPSSEPEARAVRNHAVVFVPGVTGSRLEHARTGEVLWGEAGRVFTPRDRGHSTVLPLAGDPSDDPWVATEVLSHLRLFPITREIYRPLRRTLEEHGYRLGDLDAPDPQRDLYLFAYDWRRDNGHAIEELHRALERLAAAGQQRVRLVCQSNAGRICRWVAKYGGLEPRQARLLLETGSGGGGTTEPSYRVEQLVMVSNSNGGSLRQLHELHEGRRYVPGVGRLMAPETLFALRPLFGDLPSYRDDLFLDRRGAAIGVDLFDPDTWVGYGWSIFREDIAEYLAASDADELFGTVADRRRYLEERLRATSAVNDLLLAASPRFSSGLCLLQNHGRDTIERALLLEGRDGTWRLLFAGDPGVPPELEGRLASPGDGHGTATSQDFLSAQELAAVHARHSVEGGHFETITRDATLERILDCLATDGADLPTPRGHGGAAPGRDGEETGESGAAELRR